MATQMTFQRRGSAKPPDKGSFPLDHEGECKDFMFKYMRCLRINKHANSKCRDESKDYLQCRMDRMQYLVSRKPCNSHKLNSHLLSRDPLFQELDDQGKLGQAGIHYRFTEGYTFMTDVKFAHRLYQMVKIPEYITRDKMQLNSYIRFQCQRHISDTQFPTCWRGIRIYLSMFGSPEDLVPSLGALALITNDKYDVLIETG